MKHPNTVRGFRQHHCLSQRELADLLGVSQSCVSRLETNPRHLPILSTVLALQVLVGRKPSSLYQALYEKTVDRVMARAARLDRKIRHCTDARSKAKQELLLILVKRVGRNARPA